MRRREHRDHPRTVLAWLGCVLLGCSADPAVDEPCPELPPPIVIQEGEHQRPVQLEACMTSADCPSGTQCVSSTCRLDTAITASVDVLTAGFGVRRFGATPVRDGEYILDPPRGTVYATCGLFRCVPAFGELEPGRRQITNFDQCVARLRRFAGEPTVLLSDLDPYPSEEDAGLDDGAESDGDAEASVAPQACPMSEPEPDAASTGAPDDAPACAPDPIGEPDHLAQPRASGAWFGCWAYGEIGILGATRFIDVRGQTSAITLHDDCTLKCVDGRCDVLEPDHEWLQGYAGCIRADRNGTGACVDGHCRGWCRTHLDCPLREGQGPEAAGSCEAHETCEAVPNSLLGLCSADLGKSEPQRHGSATLDPG